MCCFVQTPSSEEEQENSAVEFQEKWDFPNCVEDLVGKQINKNVQKTHALIISVTKER